MNAHAEEFDVDQADWREARVIIFAGRSDTRKRTTSEYRTMSLGDIFAMAPTDRPKDKAPAFIPSTYNAPDGRTHAVQRERGSFVTLTGDIDSGDHQLDRIKATVTDFAGEAARLLYSSSRACPGDMRWRVILPLASPLPFAEWNDAQNAFFDFMEERGIKMDRSLDRAGQPVFLPNVPATHDKTGDALRDEFGAPLYYVTDRTEPDAPALTLDTGPIAAGIEVIRQRRREDEEARAKLRAEAERKAKARAEKHIKSGGGDDESSVIDEFNRNNSIASLLAKYNYKRDPASADDWRSPKQDSQTYATRVMGDAWVSLSGSDAASGLGVQCDTGCFGDAFDLFVHYEHGGNFSAACHELHDERRAAASASGNGEGSPSPDAKPRPKRDWPFRLSASGVERRVEKEDKHTGECTVEWVWFCSPLEVAADTRSHDGESWGRLLKITDRDGTVKAWAMPMAMLAGAGQEYREKLLSLGLIMAPGHFPRQALHEYISTARPADKARCVNRIGWAGGAYAFPRVTLAKSDAEGERTIFQATGSCDDPYGTGGDLESWKREVATPCIGNTRLAFALSAAFAGPLLDPCGLEGGGFHFRGGSSIGKTTALIVTGSAWGGRDYPGTWRATANGLEGVCAMHNDGLLLLDEMGQATAKEVSDSAYMLSNGAGKARAGRDGTARKLTRWRTIFLSTGEITLAAKIAEDTRNRAKAGQEARLVDIPADAGAGLGIFENLHDFPSADAFARHLKNAAHTHFGHASHAFLQRLVDNFDAIAPRVKSHMDRFTADHCPAGADGQVSRVCARFALVAAAGEMATAAGVLPWPTGEATKAAARCFKDWIEERGGTAPAEEREHVAAVRRFIEAHGSSRFERMGGLELKDSMGEPIEQRVINRAGFKRPNPDDRDETEFLFLREIWKSEVCAGLNSSAVAKTLAARGMLKPGSGGKSTRPERLPGSEKLTRVYVIPASILGDEPANDAEQTAVPADDGWYGESPAQSADRRGNG